MKTIVFLFIGYMLLVNISQAQSFGIAAGPNFAFYELKDGNVSFTSDMITGFNAGLVASIPVARKFSLRPEIKYVQKGGKSEEDGYSDKITLNYIEVPVNFVFNTHASKGMFFAGLGPSFNLGLSGKGKGDYGDYDIKFGGSEDDDFKPFEFGINATVGYEFANGFVVSANFNQGLNNVINTEGFDAEYYNMYMGINVGFMFHSKPKKVKIPTN